MPKQPARPDQLHQPEQLHGPRRMCQSEQLHGLEQLHPPGQRSGARRQELWFPRYLTVTVVRRSKRNPRNISAAHPGS